MVVQLPDLFLPALCGLILQSSLATLTGTARGGCLAAPQGMGKLSADSTLASSLQCLVIRQVLGSVKAFCLLLPRIFLHSKPSPSCLGLVLCFLWLSWETVMVREEEDKVDSLWEFLEVNPLPWLPEQRFSQNRTQGESLQKGVAKGGYRCFFSEDLLQTDLLSGDEIFCGHWDGGSFRSNVANYR